MKKSPKYPQKVLHNSTNYSEFSLIGTNRDINPKQVAHIKKTLGIKNLLHGNPVMVNTKMQVIDGQHRFTAAKELGLPVWFLVVEANEDDIVMLNTNQRNWQTVDYIAYYAKQGDEHYIKLQSILNETNHNVSEVLELLDAKNLRQQISKGGYKVVDDNEIDRRLYVLHQVKLVFGRTLYQVQVAALKKALSTPEFDEHHFIKNLKKRRKHFYAAAGVRDQLINIEDIYNYRLSDKTRIRLFK